MGKFLRYPVFTYSAWPEDFLSHHASGLLNHRKPETSKNVEDTAFLVSSSFLIYVRNDLQSSDGKSLCEARSPA